MMNTLTSLTTDASTLPSLPAIAVRIIQEIRKDNLSISTLADIISVDPALTARMLKMANSSVYGLAQKVDSIERAVNILGIDAIKNIALSFVIVKGLKRESMDEFNQELFWKRAITSAVSAEMMSSALRTNRKDIFVTALLMDIGVLIMYLSRPDDYLSVVNEKMVTHAATIDAERKIFGFDHQESGSVVLLEWGIPENISVPIAHHHESKGAPHEHRDAAEILKLADMASSVYYGNKSAEKLKELSRLLQEKLRMSENDVIEVIDSVASRTSEILASFEIDARDVKPYSQLLTEAETEVKQLNMSYEQLAMELKQEKKRSARLAKELKGAHEKLRKETNRDNLTGMYNHRFFQEVMDREIERAERYARNLALMIMDIDHFRKINDAAGYHQADMVLRALAELLGQVIRRPDLSARYGGDEFAVVMPESDIRAAIVLTERLRKMIERLEIKIEGGPVKVTVSAGLTMYEPGKNSKSKTKLIDSAARALHYSKMTGRNKMSIVPMSG